MDKSSVREHFRLLSFGKPTERSVYLLLCGSTAVTVRSQQVRAVNLAWALQEDLRGGTEVAVVGGGAAGLTFAAAAAKLGARVHLFEASDALMPLQTGCRHRPLHPEVYTWPKGTAFRPVSHLPLLGWATGTAHDVAAELVSKFLVVRGDVNGRNEDGTALEDGPLRMTLKARAAVVADGTLKVKRGKTESELRVPIVVLAVGFGVESGPGDLPLNSYWRADPLDQPFLADGGTATVVVSGAGDGALIDVLRACVRDTDHGPLWDAVLAATMGDRTLREAVAAFTGPDYHERRGEEVERRFRELGANPDHAGTLRKIDALLAARVRPGTAVRWMYSQRHPFDSGSLPFNRFLVSRLLALAGHEAPGGAGRLALKRIGGVDPDVNVSPLKGGRYFVDYTVAGEPQPPIVCEQAVFRWGLRKLPPQPDPGQDRPRPVTKSVADAFETPGADVIQAIRGFLHREAADHEQCHLPQEWDEEFLKKLKPTYPDGRKSPPPPTLMAEFVAGFDAPDPEWSKDMSMVYRIRIWLAGLADRPWVRYDLHPEEENKPVTRETVGPPHTMWLNTRNDYQIRVRSSDGFEWPVHGVLDALKARYPGWETNPGAYDPVPVLDRVTEAPAGAQSVKEAIGQIDRQTKHRAASA